MTEKQESTQTDDGWTVEPCGMRWRPADQKGPNGEDMVDMQFDLDDDLYEKTRELAEQAGMSHNDFISKIIADHLAELIEEQKEKDE